MGISRRRFTQIAGSAALAAGPLGAQHASLTAQQVADRIQKETGVWTADSIDGFRAGDASTAIAGIATTAMATMDVLARAVKEKTNLIVTLEPVFFGQRDARPAAPPPQAPTQPPAGAPAGARGGAAAGRGGFQPQGLAQDDPVLSAKRDFIQKNGLVVLRFDHWRTHTPDPFAIGLAQVMGWTRYQAGADSSRYEIPLITLTALTGELVKKLKLRAGIRVIGDPQTRVRKVALLPGVSQPMATIKTLPEVDLLLAGEVREWESVEYAQDVVAAGMKKGFLTIGRVMSQDPGMNVCAGWLKKLVPEVPVRWLPAGDPYWRPS